MVEYILNLLAEFFDPALLDALQKLLVSVICGLIVGTERTFKGKPAGVRTNILISLGATLFMIVSLHAAAMARENGFLSSDPTRIAAQVVTGIGFLGAGTILRNRGLITGLTSAASIWAMAAIGLAAGLGMIKLALLSAFMVTFSITIFGYTLKNFGVERFKYLRLEIILKKEEVVYEIRKNMVELNIVYSHENMEIMMGEIHYTATLYFRGSAIERDLEEILLAIKGVKSVILLSQHVE